MRRYVSSLKTNGEMHGVILPLGNWCKTTVSLGRAAHFLLMLATVESIDQSIN